MFFLYSLAQCYALSVVAWRDNVEGTGSSSTQLQSFPGPTEQARGTQRLAASPAPSSQAILYQSASKEKHSHEQFPRGEISQRAAFQQVPQHSSNLSAAAVSAPAVWICAWRGRERLLLGCSTSGPVGLILASAAPMFFRVLSASY